MFLGRSQDRLAQSRRFLSHRQGSATIQTRHARGRVGPQTLIATNHLVRRKPLRLRRFDWPSKRQTNVVVIFRQHVRQVFGLYDDGEIVRLENVFKRGNEEIKFDCPYRVGGIQRSVRCIATSCYQPSTNSRSTLSRRPRRSWRASRRSITCLVPDLATVRPTTPDRSELGSLHCDAAKFAARFGGDDPTAKSRRRATN